MMQSGQRVKQRIKLLPVDIAVAGGIVIVKTANCYQNGVKNTLEIMKQDIVTCHLHDNDGYSDQHFLPGKGTINWEKLIRDLSACPRILSMQAEVSMATDVVPIRKLCTTFDGLKKYIG